MNIKQGYKQTEIGIIPEDWEIKTLGDLLDFQGGSQPPKQTFIFQEKVGYIRLLQIRDYKGDKYETYIPQNLAKKFCNADDIMIGRYGPPIFQILNGLDGAYNVALMKAIPHEEIFSKKYAWFVLKQDKLFQFVEKLSQRSSGQTGVDLFELKKYQIPTPPLKEQTAIATALSDIDALIGELDKLIAKKQGIKQATMQQLLTGKKRLSGFSGEWEVKKIGELVFDFRGGAPLAPSDFVNIGHLVLPKGAVTKGGFLRVEQEKIQYCSHKYAESHKNNVVDKNYTIVVLRDLVPSGPTIGLMVKFINDNTYVLAQGVYGFRVDETKANPDFLIQLSNSKEYRQVMQNTMVGSTQVHITNGAFKNVEIYLPSIKEQTAIANILSDMDAEISQLEGRRAKMGELKQGMMQELLTGRIRLTGVSY
ncbi:MAG: hypothetical protein RLZZ66_1776 [Pseudomonadota bacterium]|jgi:type I restriction enzyme S subunit